MPGWTELLALNLAAVRAQRDVARPARQAAAGSRSNGGWNDDPPDRTGRLGRHRAGRGGRSPEALVRRAERRSERLAGHA